MLFRRGFEGSSSWTKTGTPALDVFSRQNGQPLPLLHLGSQEEAPGGWRKVMVQLSAVSPPSEARELLWQQTHQKQVFLDWADRGEASVTQSPAGHCSYC